jgi:hypothetical protein
MGIWGGEGADPGRRRGAPEQEWGLMPVCSKNGHLPASCLQALLWRFLSVYSLSDWASGGGEGAGPGRRRGAPEQDYVQMAPRV